MPHLKRAVPADADALTTTQVRAFDDDARRFGNMPDGGGPPGYDDVGGQIMMMQRATAYFCIVEDEQIIGGAILFRQGPEHMELGRIWIDPDFQGHGWGQQIMAALEVEFPQMTRWTLETPVWATRNHHFYVRCGYVQVGPHPQMADQIVFEKRREKDAG